MRTVFVLLICVLFSNCDRKSDKWKELRKIKNSVWIDSLCNEYHFKDSLISKGLLFQEDSFIDTIELLKTDSLIKLEFNYDNENVESYFLENKRNGKLVFKPLDEYGNSKVLFKRDSIKTTGLEILELDLKVTPYFLYSGYFQISITKDKKITYIKESPENDPQTLTLSDSTFKQLEIYLENLQFDKYKSKYEFAGFDGAKYELTIKTSHYKKTIVCIQKPTEGIRNLISFIDFKIQTE